MNKKNHLLTDKTYKDDILDGYFRDNLYGGDKTALKDFIQEMERKIIMRALQICNGNQKNTARLLDIKTTTLNVKIKKMNIHIEKKAYITNLIRFDGEGDRMRPTAG